MLIHVAIVSDQILANLIPALMDRPDRVYLVTSSAMSAKGMDKRLKKQLSRQGIDAEIRADAPDTGLEAIREYALDLVDTLNVQHPGARVIFNATGGTKLMSLGFFEMFRDLASRVIYTDTAHRRIAVLHDRDAPGAADLPMPDVLDVPSYLSAQGFLYQTDQAHDEAWVERMTARKQAGKYLAKHAAELGDLIGALNAWTSSVLDKGDQALVGAPPTIRYPESARRREAWKAALDEIAKAGLIDLSDNDRIDFADAESARFLKGGWLEEYAWHIVRDERPYDVRLNVRGLWEGTQKAGNEFDVLACHRNQLLFIECKTLKFDAGQNDNDLSYKTESLGKDTRGLFGETWLLSAREPSDVLLDRSRQAGFKLLGPSELARLRSHVQAWMAPQP
jgi:hypothetical protein